MDWQEQDTELTLAEGIAAYYRQNPNLADLRDMSPKAKEFFRCHDAAHVVFGCGTSLPHEAIVKLSSIFGTTGGLGVLRGYRLHESTRIYRALTVREVVLMILRSVVIVPRAILRCLRQRERWPWNEFGAYQDVPLARLRARFGIRVPGR